MIRVNIDRDEGIWWGVLFLAPLAWAGVTGSARGEWLRSMGAWIMLFGQFFMLNYNCSHATTGITCWYQRAVLLTYSPTRAQ